MALHFEGGVCDGGSPARQEAASERGAHEEAVLAGGQAQVGLQEELLCCRERRQWPARVRPGQAPSGRHEGAASQDQAAGGGSGSCLAFWDMLTGKGSRRAPKAPSPKAAPREKVGWGCFFTSLDHLSQVGLSKNLGHPEHHQGILGADQVCAESSVQEADKELRVQQQILLDKRLPLRKEPAEGLVSQRREFLSCPGQRHPEQSAPANPGYSMRGTSWHWKEGCGKTVTPEGHFHGPQCPRVSSTGQGWREEGPEKHPNSPLPHMLMLQPHPLLPPATSNKLTQANLLPPLPNPPYAWSKGSRPDLQGPQGPQPRTHHFSDTLRSGASALGSCFSGAYLQGCK